MTKRRNDLRVAARCELGMRHRSIKFKANCQIFTVAFPELPEPPKGGKAQKDAAVVR